MLRFWRNPEFVRHTRADLRPARAFTLAVVTLVVCALVGLLCWTSEHRNLLRFFRLFYGWLVGIQYVVMGFWCASACGQAIARERELKTYDFLRTTRLTPAELLVGKVLGVPIMTYFMVACSVPVSVLVGVLGGYPLRVIAENYVLLVAFALFVSVMGLCCSLWVQKSGAVGVLALVAVNSLWLMAYGPFSGFAGLSIAPAVLSLHGLALNDLGPTLLGRPVSFTAVTLLVYATAGAWLVLMLLRNLKRDREQVRLLSRWQAVGLAAYGNLLFFAFLQPQNLVQPGSSPHLDPVHVAQLAVGLNAAILFLVGIASLTPPEKLKVWWRKRSLGGESYFSERGLAWPWLVPAALIGYALLGAEAAGLQKTIPVERWALGTAAIQLVVLLVFIARDILFLQWCTLTNMKRPVVKGLLFLCLYYFAIATFVFMADEVAPSISGYVRGLAAVYVFNPGAVSIKTSPGTYVGLVVQVPIIFLLLYSITFRIRPRAVLPAVSAAQ